jgi:hypothetical protein
LLDYDPETGLLTWRPRPREMFSNLRSYTIWNIRFPGTTAGSPSNGYIVVGLLNVNYRAHRLAWLIVHGEPVPPIIDHDDGNPLNNRIDNLKDLTQSQNLFKASIRSDNTSGFKGIDVRPWGSFRVRIGRVNIGHFATIEEARAAIQTRQ